VQVIKFSIAFNICVYHVVLGLIIGNTQLAKQPSRIVSSYHQSWTALQFSFNLIVFSSKNCNMLVALDQEESKTET